MAFEYELYTYFRSSCSARVRIAAFYKGISLSYKFINLVKDEQHDAEYMAINTSHSVPTLVGKREDGSTFAIQQSIAILEFFEESRPDLPRLLPDGAEARARVREFVNIVACDIQPVTNLKIIKSINMPAKEWQAKFMTSGLEAYERLLARSMPSRFSVGDSVTLADVVLSPAVDGALRYDVDMNQFPNIMRIYAASQALPAFRQGGWRAQPDTPESLK